MAHTMLYELPSPCERNLQNEYSALLVMYSKGPTVPRTELLLWKPYMFSSSSEDLSRDCGRLEPLWKSALISSIVELIF